MIALLRAFLDWVSGSETKRIKASNAVLEQRLMAAASAPNAPAELVEEASMYFANKPPSDSAIPKLKEGSHGSD